MTYVDIEKVESMIEDASLYEGHKRGCHKSQVIVKVFVSPEDYRKNQRLIHQYIANRFTDFCSPSIKVYSNAYDLGKKRILSVTFTHESKYKDKFLSPQALYGALANEYGNLKDVLLDIVEHAKRDQEDKNRAKSLISEVNHIAEQLCESAIKKAKEAISYQERIDALHDELGVAAKDALDTQSKTEDWSYTSGTPIHDLVKSMVLDDVASRLNGKMKAGKENFIMSFDSEHLLDEYNDEHLKRCVERIRAEAPDFKLEEDG